MSPKLLRQYVDAPDVAFRLQKLEGAVPAAAGQAFQFTSQIWKGEFWNHDFWCIEPDKLAHEELSILYITGDLVVEADLPYVRWLAQSTGLRTFALLQIPNQPLWNLREDDLVAHTFGQFIRTGEPDWPLLFPMVKSAKLALDACQEIAPQTQKFLVTGASKRAWTTWLLASLQDPRVVGIAPKVFDNLNFPEQMVLQKRAFAGGYSEMLGDYTRRSLQDLMAVPMGAQLAHEVDPYSFRSDIRCPILNIVGANDPFWVVDSSRCYWDGLNIQKAHLSVPNAGHELGDGTAAMRTISEFSARLRRQKPMPKVTALLKGQELTLEASEPFLQTKVWISDSNVREFSSTRFKVVAQAAPQGSQPIRLRLAASGDAFRALICEFVFEGEMGQFSLSDLPHVIER